MRIKLYLKEWDINKTLIVTGVVTGVFLVAFLLWWQWDSNIIGVNNEDRRPRASLTGLVCDSYEKRPIAVMMASDPMARPLSGVGQADIVIEMPITPNGITRMMVLFQCEEPEEIGSVRSARDDFLTFVKTFGAIYAHWGGEREALNKLNNGILDNIDAMKYEGTVPKSEGRDGNPEGLAIFYRKNSVPRPHNGFTTIELLMNKAEDLGYGSTGTFPGYLRTEEKPERNLSNIVETIMVNYESPYDVKWTYDSGTNTYKRIRGGETEIDGNTGRQVETSIVVLMHTASKVLSIDYISVNTVGEGKAEFYQNGVRASGTWKNDGNNLKFYDGSGGEMKFVPGKMWIEVLAQP